LREATHDANGAAVLARCSLANGAHSDVVAVGLLPQLSDECDDIAN
jgi:hypothetical protein